MEQLQQKLNDFFTERGFRRPFIHKFSTFDSHTNTRKNHMIMSTDALNFVYVYGEFSYEELVYMALDEIYQRFG